MVWNFPLVYHVGTQKAWNFEAFQNLDFHIRDAYKLYFPSMQTHRTKAQEQPQARHRVIDVATQPNYFNFKIAVTRIAFWFSTSSNKPSINVVFLLLNGFRFDLSRWSRFHLRIRNATGPGFPAIPPGSLSASRRCRCSGRSSLSSAFGFLRVIPAVHGPPQSGSAPHLPPAARKAPRRSALTCR